jgi:voltage-gated potassium channel Kch
MAQFRGRRCDGITLRYVILCAISASALPMSIWSQAMSWARPLRAIRCGLETARAVVVTMDSPASNEAVVETTRQLRPDVTLVARATPLMPTRLARPTRCPR